MVNVGTSFCGCWWVCGGHGRMHYKDGWWYCYGYDGEGCIAGHLTRQRDDHNPERADG